ncbi:MAG TPA: PRC-barrel domain-containing protein [Mycobacteriales bacterium]|nr:PRC-barrel domain-containing protein [Mycobacteriales bacterium]
MIDQASVPSLMGSTVKDHAGEKIVKVGQVYLDDTTGQPEWVTVRTGLFGTKESFVPLAAARVEGDDLVVDIAKERVADAPKIDEDGHLSEEQETELYQYYGVSQGPFGRQSTPTAGGGPTDSTYAGTETGRTGEGYPETDAGADYATTGIADAPTTEGPAAGYAATGAPAADVDRTDMGAPATDFDRTDAATGYADAGTGAPATDFDRTDMAAGAPAAGYATTDAATGAPATDFDRTDAATGYADTDAAAVQTGAAGPYDANRAGAVGDPTGTPVGDADVSDAFSGPGYGDEEADVAEAGPDFARGQDASVTGEVVDSGPDFARGEDASVTREGGSAGGPDFARGEDRSSTLGHTDALGDTGTGDRTEATTGAYGDTDARPADTTAEEPAPFKSRLRRWLSSDSDNS